MNFLDLASELIHEILLEAALKRSLSGKVVKTSACLQDLRGGLEKHTHLGNLEIVRYILDGGIKIHDWLGGPSLEAACRENHEDVVDLLLERGANLNVYYERKERLGWLGDQILCVGAEGSDLRIVRKLLDRGATLLQIWKNDLALRWAVSREDRVMLKFRWP